MPDPDHYFSEIPHTDLNLRKIFTSLNGFDLSFYTANNVFSPREIDEGTKILIENLILPQKGPLLDLGAGYGPIAIWLAKKYQILIAMAPEKYQKPEIYASEINERACWLLQRNIVENKCKEIQIIKGDFIDQKTIVQFKGVQFHAIYVNPPLKQGHDFLIQFFEMSFNLLASDGFVQYVHKKSLGADAFIHKLMKVRPQWNFEIMQKKAGYFVYLISPHEISVKS
jgi:16S rRNA (guanine1207-N2)-methyltransferase